MKWHECIAHATRHTHVCDTTHAYVSHASFVCVIWFVRMPDMTSGDTCDILKDTSTSQHAAHWNRLQRAATQLYVCVTHQRHINIPRSSTLHNTATCCNTLQLSRMLVWPIPKASTSYDAAHCNRMQHDATYCNSIFLPLCLPLSRSHTHTPTHTLSLSLSISLSLVVSLFPSLTPSLYLCLCLVLSLSLPLSRSFSLFLFFFLSLSLARSFAMSRVACMNESERVMSHVRTIYVSHMSESCLAYEWGVCDVTYQQDLSHIWMQDNDEQIRGLY